MDLHWGNKNIVSAVYCKAEIKLLCCYSLTGINEWLCSSQVTMLGLLACCAKLRCQTIENNCSSHNFIPVNRVKGRIAVV